MDAIPDTCLSIYRSMFEYSRTLVWKLTGWPGSPILLLGSDPNILTDHIIPHLKVEDVLSLRMTNKAFYLITYEPIIWKRFLERIHAPVVQLRPTLKFNDPVHGCEIEPIVMRAIAMENAWRTGHTKLKKEEVLMANFKVVDLKLLPGGNFLVASVKDRANFRFYIHLYALDVVSGSRLLARYPVPHKAFDIQAKYMDHQGKPGIMISFSTRKFTHGVPYNLQNDLANFSPRCRFDSVHPLTYYSYVIHMHLNPVEILIHPDMDIKRRKVEYVQITQALPRPFINVARFESQDEEIYCPSLFLNSDGVPFHAYAIGPDKIRIINLRTYQTLLLNFRDNEDFHGLPHRIRAFRYLPRQHGLLLARTVTEIPGSDKAFVIEIYNLDRHAVGNHQISADKSWCCPIPWELSLEVVIADPEMYTKREGSDHPDLRPEEKSCPTLWIFARSRKPMGIVYWWVRPTSHPDRYDDVDAVSHFHWNERRHEMMLPGSARNLLVEMENEILEATPLNTLRRFHWPRFKPQFRNDNLHEPIYNRQKETHFAFTDIPSHGLAADVNGEGGLATITWDELSGKICLASDKTDQIRVYDFVPLIEPRRRLAYGWRKNRIPPTLS